MAIGDGEKSRKRLRRTTPCEPGCSCAASPCICAASSCSSSSSTSEEAPEWKLLLQTAFDSLRPRLSKNNHRWQLLVQIVQMRGVPAVSTRSEDEYGWTALHFAAYHNNLDVLGLLLARGSAVDAVGNLGETPLHTCARRGDRCVPAAERLILEGASLRARNLSGRTPLHVAAAMGNERMIRLLLRYGADQNALTKFVAHSPFVEPMQLTPLGDAVRTSQLQACLLLAECGSADDTDLSQPSLCEVARVSGVSAASCLQAVRQHRQARRMCLS